MKRQALIAILITLALCTQAAVVYAATYSDDDYCAVLGTAYHNLDQSVRDRTHWTGNEVYEFNGL